MALMDLKAIPLELLSSAERKVTVDSVGLGVMHALTQVAIWQYLTEHAGRLGLATAVAMAQKLGKFDSMKPAKHCIGRRYSRHVMAVLGHVRKWGLVPAQGDAEVRGGAGGASEGWGEKLLESVREMFTRAGMFLINVGGQYGQAQDMYEMSLACGLECYGHAHADTTLSHTIVGNVYFQQCKYEKALGTLRKALEIWLKMLGPEHPKVAESYTFSGHVYS